MLVSGDTSEFPKFKLIINDLSVCGWRTSFRPWRAYETDQACALARSTAVVARGKRGAGTTLPCHRRRAAGTQPQTHALDRGFPAAHSDPWLPRALRSAAQDSRKRDPLTAQTQVPGRFLIP